MYKYTTIFIFYNYHFRLLWNISFVAFIYYTPKMIQINGFVNIPMYYYALLVFILSIHDVSSNYLLINTILFHIFLWTILKTIQY